MKSSNFYAITFLLFLFFGLILVGVSLTIATGVMSFVFALFSIFMSFAVANEEDHQKAMEDSNNDALKSKNKKRN